MLRFSFPLEAECGSLSDVASNHPDTVLLRTSRLLLTDSPYHVASCLGVSPYQYTRWEDGADQVPSSILGAVWTASNDRPNAFRHLNAGGELYRERAELAQIGHHPRPGGQADLFGHLLR